MSRQPNSLLFKDGLLENKLSQLSQKMSREIDDIDSNSLLNTTIEDACDIFEENFTVEPIVLLDDQIEAEQPRDLQVDVRGEPDRIILDSSQPALVPGTAVTIYVPFSGDADLFRYRPNQYTQMNPSATVRSRELALTFTRTDQDGDAVMRDFDAELSRIRQWVVWVNNQVEHYNHNVRALACSRLEARREKFLKDRQMTASIRYPLRARSDAPTTEAFPVNRKPITIAKLAPNTPGFQPEPELVMEEYEHILQVVHYMGAVMERMPSAFVGMGEEDLRAHFLVQLNGQYEGQATGETFNFNGKTDILIAIEGRNIFIGECKFWQGPEKFRETIDQLLGYATWRDTKVALLIFNRNVNFSEVVEKMRQGLKEHPNFKREMPFASESGCRVVLHQRDDVHRDLIVTSLAFNIPQKRLEDGK